MVLLDEKFYKGLAADVEDLMTTMYGRGRLAIGAILYLCEMLTMYEVFGMCKTGGGAGVGNLVVVKRRCTIPNRSTVR